MAFLAELWLPIVVSAVLVFIVSSIFHMAIPIHRNDFRKLPGEDEILDAMRARNVARGQYMFPCPGSMKEMSSPEMLEKYRRGPVGFMVVMRPGPPAMGRSLVQWFVFTLLIGLFAAYLGWHAAGAGATFAAAFRFTGTTAVVGYAATHVVDSIWKGQAWAITAKFIFEGVVYGLVTAATFGWLWPGAA